MIKYYPFELHTHTIHSDGRMSPKALVSAAKERGLSGIAITDHNTTSGVSEVVKIGKEEGLVVIRGIEWTTYHGHLTVLGGNSGVNWRDITLNNINDKIKEAVSSGDIVNIAHAKRMGSPICTGCYMEYDIDKSLISGYEVWSNPRPYFNKTNSNALDEYDEICKSGYKTACLYGDDWHDIKSNKKQYAVTYLGIDGELNAENAVDAIRKRRTFISTGIKANIVINTEMGTYQIGETIREDIININGIVDYSNDYCISRRVIPKNVVIYGNAAERRSYKVEDNIINITDLRIKKGYLRLAIEGEIEGEEAELLLTSPIYKEE